MRTARELLKRSLDVYRREGGVSVARKALASFARIFVVRRPYLIFSNDLQSAGCPDLPAGSALIAVCSLDDLEKLPDEI